MLVVVEGDCNLIEQATFSWQMTGIAMISAVSGARELPRSHTLDFEFTVEYSNGRKIHSKNRVVNGGPRTLASEIAMPVQMGIDNPFQKIMPAKISGKVIVTPTALSATLVTAKLNKQKYRPGDVVSGHIFYRPFREDEVTMPFDFTLPSDLPDGAYQLIVGDADRHSSEEFSGNAWKFISTDVDTLLDSLQTLNSIRRDALYVKLVRPNEGIAVGRTAMPKLPASRKALLMSSGRGDVAVMSNVDVKIIPTSLVFQGSADLSITIEANPHGEQSVKPAAPATLPSGPPQRPASP